MANRYGIDTHALFWYLISSPKLSQSGRNVFARAFTGDAELVLTPIVLLELYGLIRKINAPIDFGTELAFFEQPPFHVEPITTTELYLLDRLEIIPELHDRLIAAVAFRLNVPLLTRDPLITACPDITCIW